MLNFSTLYLIWGSLTVSSWQLGAVMGFHLLLRFILSIVKGCCNGARTLCVIR